MSLEIVQNAEETACEALLLEIKRYLFDDATVDPASTPCQHIRTSRGGGKCKLCKHPRTQDVCKQKPHLNIRFRHAAETYFEETGSDILQDVNSASLRTDLTASRSPSKKSKLPVTPLLSKSGLASSPRAERTERRGLSKKAKLTDTSLNTKNGLTASPRAERMANRGLAASPRTSSRGPVKSSNTVKKAASPDVLSCVKNGYAVPSAVGKDNKSSSAKESVLLPPHQHANRRSDTAKAKPSPSASPTKTPAASPRPGRVARRNASPASSPASVGSVLRPKKLKALSSVGLKTPSRLGSTTASNKVGDWLKQYSNSASNSPLTKDTSSKSDPPYDCTLESAPILNKNSARAKLNAKGQEADFDAKRKDELAKPSAREVKEDTVVATTDYDPYEFVPSQPHARNKPKQEQTRKRKVQLHTELDTTESDPFDKVMGHRKSKVYPGKVKLHQDDDPSLEDRMFKPSAASGSRRKTMEHSVPTSLDRETLKSKSKSLGANFKENPVLPDENEILPSDEKPARKHKVTALRPTNNRNNSHHEADDTNITVAQVHNQSPGWNRIRQAKKDLKVKKMTSNPLKVKGGEMVPLPHNSSLIKEIVPLPSALKGDKRIKEKSIVDGLDCLNASTDSLDEIRGFGEATQRKSAKTLTLVNKAASGFPMVADDTIGDVTLDSCNGTQPARRSHHKSIVKPSKLDIPSLQNDTVVDARRRLSVSAVDVADRSKGHIQETSPRKRQNSESSVIISNAVSSLLSRTKPTVEEVSSLRAKERRSTFAIELDTQALVSPDVDNESTQEQFTRIAQRSKPMLSQMDKVDASQRFIYNALPQDTEFLTLASIFPDGVNEPLLITTDRNEVSLNLAFEGYSAILEPRFFVCGTLVPKTESDLHPRKKAFLEVTYSSAVNSIELNQVLPLIAPDENGCETNVEPGSSEGISDLATQKYVPSRSQEEKSQPSTKSVQHSLPQIAETLDETQYIVDSYEEAPNNPPFPELYKSTQHNNSKLSQGETNHNSSHKENGTNVSQSRSKSTQKTVMSKSYKRIHVPSRSSCEDEDNMPLHASKKAKADSADDVMFSDNDTNIIYSSQLDNDTFAHKKDTNFKENQKEPNESLVVLTQFEIKSYQTRKEPSLTSAHLSHNQSSSLIHPSPMKSSELPCSPSRSQPSPSAVISPEIHVTVPSVCQPIPANLGATLKSQSKLSQRLEKQPSSTTCANAWQSGSGMEPSGDAHCVATGVSQDDDTMDVEEEHCADVENREQDLHASTDDSDDDVLEPTPQKSVSNVKCRVDLLKRTEQRAPLCLLGTSLTPRGNSLMQRFAEQFNASFVSSFGENVTHLVHDKSDGRALRTFKYLCAVASQKWVLSIEWVERCLSTNKIVPEDEFELLDTSGTNGPQRSRQSTYRIFKNYTFFMIGPFTGDISYANLRDLIMLAGGSISEDPKPKSHNSVHLNYIALVDRDNNRIASEALYWLQQFKILSLFPEWVMESIGFNEFRDVWECVPYDNAENEIDDAAKYYPSSMFASNTTQADTTDNVRSDADSDEY